MNTNKPAPAPVAAGDLSPAQQLRADYEAIRDERAIAERAAAEAEQLVKMAAQTTNEAARRAINLDLVFKNQEGGIAKARAQSAAKNLAQHANEVIAELGAMQGRAALVLAAIQRHVLAEVRKTLAPFFHPREVGNAVAMASAVRELEAFTSQHTPHHYGFEFENDGAGGVRLCQPISAPAILAAHEAQRLSLAAIEERARKLSISHEALALSAEVGSVGVDSTPRRRIISPKREQKFSQRVQVRVMDSISLGLIDGVLTYVAPGDILDLPITGNAEGFGPCLARELIESGRVEVLSALPKRPAPFFQPITSGPLV